MNGGGNSKGVYNPSNLMLFSYTHNNPVNLVDPDGKDTAVAIGYPTKNNPFGHVAIAFSKKGVYSYGTKTKPGSSFISYLKKQTTYRDTKIYIIKTTKSQESKMLNKIKTYIGKKLPNPKKEPIKSLQDTCAVRTQKTLESGNIKSIFVPFISPLPGDTEIIAKQNSKQVFKIKQGGKIPIILNEFDNKDFK